MQAIRRKLNSQRGASMLMALLLMLVGIMVSAVIISAATSAAVNKRSEKEQQQAYLAVSSAAELVRDDFQSVAGRYKLVTTLVKDEDGSFIPVGSEVTGATCAVGDIINDIGERLMGAVPSNTYDKTYTFSIDGYEDVTANFLIASGTSTSGEAVYDLTVIFTNGASSEHPCRMVLTMEGKVGDDPRQEGDIKYRTQTLEWNKAKLQKEVTG